MVEATCVCFPTLSQGRLDILEAFASSLSIDKKLVDFACPLSLYKTPDHLEVHFAANARILLHTLCVMKPGAFGKCGMLYQPRTRSALEQPPDPLSTKR